MSIEALISELGDAFAGLWKVHYWGAEVKWCVTFSLGGRYHETRTCKTPEGALKAAGRILSKERQEVSHI